MNYYACEHAPRVQSHAEKLMAKRSPAGASLGYDKHCGGLVTSGVRTGTCHRCGLIASLHWWLTSGELVDALDRPTGIVEHGAPASPSPRARSVSA